MAKQKILVIDDDMEICMLLSKYLERSGFETETVFNGKKALATLSKQKFDCVLTDFRLPDHGGLDLIKDIRKIAPDSAIVVITGYSDVRMAIRAIKLGVYEYVTKPLQPDEILLVIKDAITAKQSSSGEAQSKTTKKTSTKKPVKESYVVGVSARSKSIQQSIEMIAPTPMSVIILGETGTGKEVAARAIHSLSPRSNKAFIAVDCGALPKELAGSELFGHVKGAFTGAVKDKEGVFELADGGTLFLDEVGNLSYENQIKLLRVIQERRIKRVGDTKDKTVDVRILAATNEDLKSAVQNGTFREDLYYRLNEFKIELPPLRERREDIPTFATYFRELANTKLNKEVKDFTAEVMQRMQEYFWHGNLRELRNVIQRAVLMTTGDRVEIEALPQEIIDPVFIPTMTDAGADEEVEVTDLKSVAELAEKKAIISVLKKTGYNKTRTAEILKVDRKTLYNKINAYNIEL